MLISIYYTKTFLQFFIYPTYKSSIISSMEVNPPKTKLKIRIEDQGFKYVSCIARIQKYQVYRGKPYNVQAAHDILAVKTNLYIGVCFHRGRIMEEKNLRIIQAILTSRTKRKQYKRLSKFQVIKNFLTQQFHMNQTVDEDLSSQFMNPNYIDCQS